MSLLTVEKVTHGFGARQILEDASFRLLKGEHIGLIGANGEGKSTFMNIITGKLQPDEGKVEWAKRVRQDPAGRGQNPLVPPRDRRLFRPAYRTQKRHDDPRGPAHRV